MSEKLQSPFGQTPYKIDQAFGVSTSYGPHEGWDINGLGGGNTDCGTPLYPFWDCEIISATSSASGYGKLLIYRVDTPRGPRYIRYAHCQEFLVKTGDSVSRNTPIAKMGSTGNSTACHLHLDILSKQPSNWRFYAKTKAELDEWFINPQEFITVYKDGIPGQPEPSNPPQISVNKLLSHIGVKDENEGIRVWDQEMGFLKASRERVGELELSLTAEKDKHQATKQTHNLFVEQVSKLLGSPNDEQSIIEFASKFNALIADAEKEKIDREKEITSLKDQLKEQDEELIRLRGEIEILATRITNLTLQVDKAIEEKKEIQNALETSTKFASFWRWLAQLTKR